jgi:hypothetical protein
MKKLLLAFALLLTVTEVGHSQCNGTFPNNTVCGNVTGSSNLPRPTTPSAFLGAAGGTNGQIQYNNAGALGGFTMAGDCTVAIPNITCTKTNGVAFGSFATGTNAANLSGNLAIARFNGGSGASAGTFWRGDGTWASNNTGFVTPADYNFTCDGTTDVTTAFQSMVTGSGGKTIYIPAGPACVISAHINLISNTTITGGGRDASTIKQIGADYVFGYSNIDNVVIQDVYLLGNRAYTSWSASNFGAWVINNTATHSNYTFRRLKVSNFNASYWMYHNQTTGIGSNLTFDDIIVNSAVADIPTDPTVTNNTNYAFVLFSGTAGVRWENVTVNNLQIDGVGLCFGYVNFSNTYKYRITDGRFLNMGGANNGGHCTNGLGATNAYGIAIYDLNSDGNPANDGIVSRNYFLNPIAAGIYVVGDGISFARANNHNNLLIIGNESVGQTNTDVLLPRGGIVVNLSTDVEVVGNYLYNNAFGINIASQSAGSVSVLSNHCDSVAGGSICLQETSGANGSSNTDRRTARGNYFNGFGTSVIGASLTGARFNVIDFADNMIVANGTGLSFVNQFVSGQVSISNNTFGGAGTIASIGGLTGNMYINNNANLSVTVGGLPAAVNGSSVFVSDGTPATCAAAGTGTTAFRQNGAWKCF